MGTAWSSSVGTNRGCRAPWEQRKSELVIGPGSAKLAKQRSQCWLIYTVGAVGWRERDREEK